MSPPKFTVFAFNQYIILAICVEQQFGNVVAYI